MKTIIRAVGAAAGASALALGLAGCPGSPTNPIEAGGDLPTAAATTVSPCSPPGTNPKFIAIVGQGITSHVVTGMAGPASFNPATASYCTSPDGKSPPDNPQVMLQDMADSWLDWKCPVDVYAPCKSDNHTIYYPHDLIDALAQAGGYVLPFSYVGATMSGTQDHPSFSFTSYSGDDVGSTDPVTAGPAALQSEIVSIHKVFPHTKIIVVAHSNGGLIAEQWWLQYAQRQPQGVVQVFSLDSPLNGVAGGVVCAAGVCGGTVDPIVGAVYATLWAHQDIYGPIALKVDAKDHLFTAIADLGDPLYDSGDYPAAHKLGVKNIGLVSQLYFTEPQCSQTGYDLSSSACTATGQAILNPCGHNLNDGIGPDFGMPVDLWLHSVVKNCPGTIQAVLHYATARPAPSPSPTPQCTAFSSACPDGPGNSSPSAPAPSAAPSSTATPGYATPQDAVAGFYQGELAGDWSAVCSYVVPSAQSLCLAGTSGQGAATGSITVDSAVIQGTEALVGVTGNICAPSTPCVTNSDPTLGMPPSPSQFAAYYAKAVANGTSSTTTVISPMPCSQIGGKWYVAFG
jgi:hypothetical protein